MHACIEFEWDGCAMVYSAVKEGPGRLLQRGHGQTIGTIMAGLVPALYLG